MTTIFIRELWIYPIKSLGGVRVDATAITSAGSLELDREWIVVDSDSRKVWQGDIPRMTLVHVALSEHALTLSMDGMAPFHLSLDHGGASTALTMYNHDFTGIDAGNEAAAWLSSALGQSLRLIRIGDAAHRWSGLNPVHLVSDASITALNEALVAQDDEPVTAMRFRPNVIVGSNALPGAWLEEENAVLDFGDARIALREPCIRCELPNISLIDASRGTQPLKIIGRLSKDRTTAAPASFGTYCTAEGATLRTGMVAAIA